MTSEIKWQEPFVLYYDDEKCIKMAKETDENNLKFSIQMMYTDDSNKKQPKEVVVCGKQRFQVD